jgi:hypothetical protein
MSGGIHFLTIAMGKDTVHYELMNTFDYTALKITDIINQYLPADKKLWPDEQLIKRQKDCEASMKKQWEEDGKKAKRKLK